MLFINADDWGSSKSITDSIQECIDNNVIDSISAMVFMSDSERAADKIMSNGMGAGLHLNFTTPFDGKGIPQELIDAQMRIVSYLGYGKLTQFIYNPLLNRDFEYVFKMQCEEYFRLYQCVPSRMDGHNHMHLCANMLIGDFIPRKIRVRRNNTFATGEKNIINRTYRSLVDKLLEKRYVCTDCFFHIYQFSSRIGTDRLKSLSKLVELSRSLNVELLAHPQQKSDGDFLNSEEFIASVSKAKRGRFDAASIALEQE